MFERFRRRGGGGAHLRAKKRIGEWLGYLMVTANRRNGRLYLSTRTWGSFEPFENDETVVETLKLKERLGRESKSKSNNNNKTTD